MYKKYLGLLLIVLLILITIPGYSYSGITVVVDGIELDLTEDPMIINEKPIVPLWDVLEAMGFQLEWKNHKKTIEGAKDSIKVKFNIGSKTTYVDGEPIVLKRSILNKNDTPMLHVDFLEEGLLARTEWDYECKKLSITTINELKVHFIDVDNGEAIFIEYFDNNILIDTGTEQSSKVVVDYLNNLDIEDIKILVLTHKDNEHIGGLKDIVNNFRIENIIRTNKICDERWVEDFIRQPKMGSSTKVMEDKEMTFDLGNGVYFYVIETGDNYEIENNNSAVTMLEHNNLKILFTGDMEKEVEESNLDKFTDVDILKVANSGMNTSTPKVFLEKINPEAAVVFTHSEIDNTEITNRLQDEEIEVFETDKLGSIIVTMDGRTYEVSNNLITGLKVMGIDFTSGTIILKNLTNKEFDIRGCMVTDRKGELVFKIAEDSILKPDAFMIFNLVFDEEKSTKNHPVITNDHPSDSDKGVLYDPNWNIITKYPRDLFVIGK